MITKFNIFNEGLIPNGSNLTYSEMLDLYKLDSVIKNYVIKKYPIEDIKLLGKYGYTMTKTSLDRTLKFAKKNNDTELINLINSHLNTIKNFNNNPEAYRTAKKYNL